MKKGLKPALLAAVIGLHGCGEVAETQATSSSVVAPVQASTSVHLKPQHFATVEELVEDFADFSEENGTFKVLSSQPLHIQMAAQVVANDLPETVQTEVQRAALYGIYRTLIHTDAPSVHVTAVPMVVTLNPYSSRFLDSPKVDLEVTREQALQAAKKHAGADTLDELVAPDASMGIQLDSWSKAFEPFYYRIERQRELLSTLGAK